MRTINDLGFAVPDILIPQNGTDLKKWAVIACDQYTSEPEYWKNVEDEAGDAPSTLNLVLPEVYLNTDKETEKLGSIAKTARAYLDEGILQSLGTGFIMTDRSTSLHPSRRGLMAAIDLEGYSFEPGNKNICRATEGTVLSRIPPRVRIRANSPLELPHIMILIDDPRGLTIEKAFDMAEAEGLAPLYDTDLMLDGGHITGWLVDGEKDVQGAIDAMGVLTDADAFKAKYGDHAPLLFAMGDGNHSFATAKANWEKVKATLTPEEQKDHPARYALVEVENVHDDGIIFEPIHRVLFGLGGMEGAEKLLAKLKAQNGDAKIVLSDDMPKASGGEVHTIPFCTGMVFGAFVVEKPAAQLAVGTLQNAIDALLKETEGAEVDYIHGEAVVRDLASKPDTMGFLLPAMQKSELFPTVVYDGALPRKTFSMGEANEKRYYLECRLIEK